MLEGGLLVKGAVFPFLFLCLQVPYSHVSFGIYYDSRSFPALQLNKQKNLLRFWSFVHSRRQREK
jgi:hypothetical protein